jgi:hypothetical protein
LVVWLCQLEEQAVGFEPTVTADQFSFDGSGCSEFLPKLYGMDKNPAQNILVWARFSTMPKTWKRFLPIIFGQTSGGDQNIRPYPILWNMEYGHEFLLPVEMLSGPPHRAQPIPSCLHTIPNQARERYVSISMVSTVSARFHRGSGMAVKDTHSDRAGASSMLSP